MKHGRLLGLILLIAATWGTAPTEASGVLTGTVSGLILDQATGEPLSGAEVLLTNTRTGATRRTLTDDNGQYVLSQVYPPGIYSITGQLTGYQTVESTNLSVAINDTATPVPPIILQRMTGPSTTLTVEARSAVVNTSDSARKMVMDAQAAQTLPLSGVRTFDDLALLAPGVYEVPVSGGSGPGVGPGVGTAGQFSVNGQRGRNNNFLVDGSDNNDQDVGVRRQGYVSLVPQSIESVEQFQVIAGNYAAEFGRNSGAVANAVSRTGGNDFHGTFYGYYTNDSLSARNFFDQRDGPAAGETPSRRSQYGFALGGPVVRDHTFWFGSFEQQRILSRPERHFAVPTAAERSFFGVSPLADANNNGLDDLTEFFFGQGFALFGLAGESIWGLVPRPNNPVGPYGANTHTRQLNADGDGTIFSFKLDTRLAEAHSLTGRYNFTDDASTLPVTGGAINSSIRPEVRTQNLSLFLNSVLGTNAANQARVSFGRTNLDFREVAGSPLLFGSRDTERLLSIFQPPPGSSFDRLLRTPIATDFGSGSYGPFGATGALGQMVIRPYSPLGVDVANFPQSRVNNTFQYADTYTHRVGSHILKGGFDIRRSQQNSRLDRNVRSIAEFNGGFSPSVGGFFRGRDLASIAYATGFLQTLIPDFNDDGRADFDTGIGLRFTEYNLFLQDDWKVSPRVTLNYGIRYEFNSTPTEVNDKIESTFGNLLAGIPAQSNLPVLAPFQRAFDPIVAALRATIGGRDKIYDSDRNNFAPRFGIAIDPAGDGKTAIRAGYGLFFDQNISAVTSQSRNVFPRLIPLNTSGFGFADDGLLLLNPQNLIFGDGRQVFPILSVGTVNTLGTPGSHFTALIGAAALQGGQGVAFTVPDKNLDTPYAQHFHLTVEREIMRETVLSAAYVGSRGINLTRFRSPNGGIAGVPGLFDGGPSVLVPGLNDLITQTAPPRRIDSRLGAYTLFENTARSKYNSFQLAAQRRFSGGLQFTGAWTWAHATDDVSDVFDGMGFFAIAQDDRNLRAEHGSASFDAQHRFASSWVWDMPWGGREWYGGWRLAGLFISQTAQPFTVNSSFDINNDGLLTDRLNTDRGIQHTDRGPAQYVLPSGAVQEGIGTGLLAPFGENGAVGRNTFRARGLASLDVSLFKTFHIDEAMNVEFRTEFFNLFNRTHFGVPVRILESPSFGRAVNTALEGRHLQFALKFTF